MLLIFKILICTRPNCLRAVVATTYYLVGCSRSSQLCVLLGKPSGIVVSGDYSNNKSCPVFGGFISFLFLILDS